MPDLTPTIEQAATEPASASGDNQAATAHPLPEQIAADRYLKGAAALAGPNARGGRKSGAGAIRYTQYLPGGTV